MARTFPFETPNTVPSAGATNGFHYEYKSTDNMHNLMANNLLVVGEYPENLFWGGVSYEDVPQLYYGAIKYDYEARTITIDNLFDNSFEDAEFTPRQLSYAWIADTQEPYNSSLTTGQLNWGINFGEDFNNTSYLDSSKAGNFPNNCAPYTRFADDIPVNKLGIAVNVLYINIIDWNNLTGSVNPGTCIQQTSLANFIGMRDNDPNYSNYRLVGFVSVGRQTLQGDGTIRLLSNNAFWYNTPMNLLMGNYINSPVSNIYQTNYRLNSASSGADRTILSYGTYIYKDGSYGFLVDSKTGVLVNQYNGDQTFDISEFLNSGNEYKRLRYNNGDRYLLYYDFHRGGYWGLLQILPVYDSLDDLLKVIAGYGLFFTAAPLAYESINNDNIYVPVLDDDNIYHGEYTHGETNLTNDYFEKGKNNDSTYEPKDPEKEEGGEDSPSSGERNSTGAKISGVVSGYMPSIDDFVNYAKFTAEGVKEFTAGLWNIPTGIIDRITTAFKNNFFDYIIGMTYYPLNIGSVGEVQTKLNIGKGGTINIPSGFVTPTESQIFDFGNIKIQKRSTAPEPWFYDYPPYTTISIFLPFAGEFELPVNQIMNRTINLKLVIDLTTGSGIWAVYCTSIEQPILIKQCQIGVELPISGVNRSQMCANMINAEFQTVQHTVTGATQLALAATAGQAGSASTAGEGSAGWNSGAVTGMMAMTLPGALLNGISDQFNKAAANKEIPHYIGGSTGAAACSVNHTPYIVYRKMLFENPSNYNKTVGKKLCATKTIRSLDGYTVCRNVDVSGISNATSNERAQIKQIMESGFYC